MSWRRAILCVTLVWLAVPGCVSNIRSPYDPDGSPPPVAFEPCETVFAYARTLVEPTSTLQPELESEHYRVYDLRFPSIGENGQTDNMVTALYYQSKEPGPRRIVIVLPIWGGYTYPPEKISAHIRKHSQGGTHVLWVQGHQYLFEWDAMANAATEEKFVEVAWRQRERIRATVIDLRRLLDWAEARPAIDASRMGLVGFSMGAMVAGVLLVDEPRLAATVLVMGAANPGDVFAACPGRASAVRKSVTARLGWTYEQYRDLFREVFDPCNPVRVAGKVDPARVLLIDALYDRCMPADARDALWHALGQPERITYRFGHTASFLAMTPLGFNSMRREIHQFLDRALEGHPVRPTSASKSPE